MNRAVGGLLSHAITVAHGAEGLPDGTVRFTLRGSAGQSFGAWLAPGVELTLWGDANDYTGKGLSGGTIAIRPPEGSTFAAEENVIVGNTVLYGATKGKAFFRGPCRRAVRRPELGRGRGDRGRRRPRLRVHDRRSRRRARPHRPQLRSGHERRASPTSSTTTAASPGRCNHELVDLEELETRTPRSVWSLVEEHRQRTGSPVAARVLAEFDELPPRFVKVMPRDYRAALEALAAGQRRAAVPRRPADLERRRGVRHRRGRERERRADGRARGLPQDRPQGLPRARPEGARRRLPRVRARRSRATSSPPRARAAWSAACRSATTAARSTT